ncbi:hypothetical protein [Thioclava sp. GXIMD2076]|uniref:ABC transporter substrate-binding protein n=1 Tax=Thioclava kandeliae TaxID=3070818 RepID=A0ABV1SEK2_9RHOB
MKLTRRLMIGALSATALLTQPIIASAQNLPKNIRMVIGSKSTGGDTYQISAMVADALSEKLGVNVKVDAVGATAAFKALERDKRGTTIMMFHDFAYLGELYKGQGFVNPFTHFAIGPTVAINPANAYLVAKNSPYQSMDDILKAAVDGTRIRVAIQPGGVSELGFSAMKNAANVMKAGAGDNIVAVNTGSQSDKNQAMWDGLADVINGSIQSNEQFTQLPADDQKAMRFIWLTSAPDTLAQAPEEGMGKLTRDDMLKYASPQTHVPLNENEDFIFDKEFFFIYNKDTDPAMIDAIDAALKEIYDEGELQKKETEAFFIPDFKPSAQAREELEKKRELYGKVINDISN